MHPPHSNLLHAVLAAVLCSPSTAALTNIDLSADPAAAAAAPALPPPPPVGALELALLLAGQPAGDGVVSQQQKLTQQEVGADSAAEVAALSALPADLQVRPQEGATPLLINSLSTDISTYQLIKDIHHTEYTNIKHHCQTDILHVRCGCAEAALVCCERQPNGWEAVVSPFAAFLVTGVASTNCTGK